MRLHPEVVLLGDHTIARCRWTLDRETERIAALMDEHPAFAAEAAKNGWTARAIAWGHIIHGVMDVADFDDERGRTG